MPFGDKKAIDKKYSLSEFFAMKEPGQYRIRIVSPFVDYGMHYFDEVEKGVTKRRAEKCVGRENNCPYCKMAIADKKFKVKVQWLGWVIDRASGEFKKYQMNLQVFNEINRLSCIDEYSFDGIPPYDIIIEREGKGQFDTKYKVTASRTNTPLTAEEMEAVSKLPAPQDILEDERAGKAKKYEGEDPSATDFLKDDEEIAPKDIPF
jgi:hypothetical protein